MPSGPGPRHLAGPRTDALIERNRSVAITVTVLLLLVLAVVAARLLASGLSSRSGPRAGVAPPTTAASVPSRPQAGSATPGPTAAPASSVPGNLVRNGGFEAGLGGWRPLGGARVDLADAAHEGGFGIRLTRGATANPGVACPAVTITRAEGGRYLATAWVRASAPGLTGEINLLEYVEGRRFATFRSGLHLRDTRWHRLQVAHAVHVNGSTLALEVVAPGLPAGAELLVDDVTVRQAR